MPPDPYLILTINKFILIGGGIFLLGIIALFAGKYLPESEEKSPASSEINTVAEEVTTTVETTAVPTTQNVAADNNLVLSSSAFAEGETLPQAHTCDGIRSTPPLEWSGGPSNTVSYAIIMDHSPGPNDYKWYWTLYNIPKTVTAIAENESVGTLGTNSVDGQVGYAPPCSKGSGAKDYTFTVYALSANINLSPSNASRAGLLSVMEGLILDSATVSVVVTR